MAENESRTTHESEAAEDVRPSAQPKGKRVWLRVLIVTVIALVLAFAALAGLFAWDRWHRYDDEADFQGSWYPTGSTEAIVIDGAAMVFDDETKYSYQLDTHAKTVTYSLGNMVGEGHYWFADDRSVLVIEDGDSFDATSTALGDLKRMFAGLDAAADGKSASLPDGDGVTVLARAPDPAAVQAKAQARAAAEAEAAAAAEVEAEAEAQAAAEAEAASAEGESDEEESDSESEPQDFTNESMGILEK